MSDVGESIAAAYLRFICNCDFIDTNKKINIAGVPGEIDVIGIDSEQKHIYIAEVAIHTGGLQYINQREGTIDNVERLIKKFERAIRYTNEKYKDYKKTFMFWSPIVRPTKTNGGQREFSDLDEIQSAIKKQFNVTIRYFVNQDFMNAIDELKSVAGNIKGNLTDPILRLYQIEEVCRNKFGNKPAAIPSKSKSVREKKHWNPKAGTIGATVKDYLETHNNPIYEEIHRIVLSKFPDSAFNKNHFSWYRNHTTNLANTGHRDDAAPKLRQGTIKSAMMSYLQIHSRPKYDEMEKIALRIKPNSAFDVSHFNWYLNFFKKNNHNR